MNKELKRAIINYVFDNYNVFNLNNITTKHFTAYIYDSKGEYLIGGQDVSNFIDDTIRLIQHESR